jgi:hypothetical protein
MSGRSFKGNLAEIGFPDVLEYLRASRKTGVLVFRQDRIKKTLNISNGNVVFASSNLADERLGDLLLAWGIITRDQYNTSVAMLSSKKRQGRILVEMGAISPKVLWEGVQNQIRHIVYSLFEWNQGLFYFAEGELPSTENITADVGITQLILEGIRRIRNLETLANRFQSQDVIFTAVHPPPDGLNLEPFEKHVLSFVNGYRSLQEICRDSEIGNDETLKVLYMLFSIGYIKLRGKTVNEPPDPQRMTSEQAATIIGNYNRMFSYLYRYMLREVGPITEHVLNKYLMDLKETNGSVLKDVTLRKDGTLDALAVQANVKSLEDGQKDTLISALNEFLYSSILAVKRTLGPEHESRVIETLKDIRPEL